MSRTTKQLLRVAAGLSVVFLVLMVRSQEVRPKLKVAKDGWPTGHATPEGAACDLARAFIKKDAALFTNTCLSAFGSGKTQERYAAFLRETLDGFRQEAAKATPSLGGPAQIGKVFAARHLTADGPAAYAAKAFDYKDIMFVDVGVFLHDKSQSVTRTFVVCDRKGAWYVHPAPTMDSLLSVGLNSEGNSIKDFADAYQVER